MIDFVKPSHVFLDVEAKDVDEVLHFISDKAVELGIATDEDALFKAFRKREDMGSTAMTDGYAIPHAQDPKITDTAVIVVKFAGSPEWKSMDGAPVKFAIALMVPTEQGGTVHLEMLSKIARVLTHVNFRNDMEKAETAEDIAAAINARLHD